MNIKRSKYLRGLLSGVLEVRRVRRMAGRPRSRRRTIVLIAAHRMSASETLGSRS
jgi:hypothetical protein